MKIKTVGITNFRGITSVVIDFNAVTTLIGPNGAGKSSVLRALDWFFNGTKNSLDANDLCKWVPGGSSLEVMVTFYQLTDRDRAALKKYAPPGKDEVSFWKSWGDGEEKLTGKALAFTPFEAVRAISGATLKKGEYQKVQREHPELDLENWSSEPQVSQFMDQWESEHPSLLSEATVSATNLFGFNGQAQLSGIFDFVFVSADLRAKEESEDNKSSILGRLLEKSLDKSSAEVIIENAIQDAKKIIKENAGTAYREQLELLSKEFSDELSQFTAGKAVKLSSPLPELKTSPSKFEIEIDSGEATTPVDREGHGFQRSLVISALNLLSKKQADNNQNTSDMGFVLAIEEPELYQHPSQAKHFAHILRELTHDGNSSVQVLYATHSTYFLEPRYFDDIRRVHHVQNEGGFPEVRVESASLEKVISLVEGRIDEPAVRSRLENACLKNIRDGFFAKVVILVEGPTDKAILEAVAAKSHPLASRDIEVVDVGSKEQLFLPMAILAALKIPFFVVFDSDLLSAKAGPQKKKKGADESADADIEKHRKTNNALLKFLGQPQEDWPSGVYGEAAYSFKGDLEQDILADWREFQAARENLIRTKRGFGGKNAATYSIAANTADNPPKSLEEIIDIVFQKSAKS